MMTPMLLCLAGMTIATGPNGLTEIEAERQPEQPVAHDQWSCEILMPEGVGRDAFTASTWPGGVVPYEFNANVTPDNQARARNAMDEIEAVCGVTFVPRTTEINRLRITASDANNSFIGPVGGPQTVNIVSWNLRFIIVHELVHALGSWHEHQRPDRDQFVQINLQNVEPGQEHNFSIRPDVFPVGDYDFDSVMHYGQFTFSANGQPVITVLPPNEVWQAQIGQIKYLSDGDIDALVEKYGAAIAPDLSGDGMVDSVDLAILLAAWGTPGADFSGDGTTDSVDLAILLAAWG